MFSWYALEQRIEDQMSEAHVPGLALAIVQGSQIVYARGFGVTSVEDDGLPVTPQTLFPIGSVTKPLVGTAVMRLVERGLLELNRPVTAYIPWLSFSEPGVVDHVTLRMLMSHTAGLPTDHDDFGARDPGGLEAFVRECIPSYPLVAPPGTLYVYSNLGLNLVGYIAEAASGKPFPHLMHELLFEPLEMMHTTFERTVAMTYPLAQPHELHEDGTVRVQHRFPDNPAYHPSGFAISTVLDLANFALLHMSGGRFRDRQVLAPELVAEMQTVHADQYTPLDMNVGLTFFVGTDKGTRRLKHAGNISTFSSLFEVAPDAGAAVVILVNRYCPDFPDESIMTDIFDQILALPPKKPFAPSPIEPERALWPGYTGAYLGEGVGVVTVAVIDGRLSLTLNGVVVPLEPLRNDLYVGHTPGSAETISIGFVPADAGPIGYVIVSCIGEDPGPPARDIVTTYARCERIERDVSFVPDPSRWAAYAGTYSGDDGGMMTVRTQDNLLLIHAEWLDEEMAGVPLDNSRFGCALGLVEFDVADDGSVLAVRVNGTATLTRLR